MNGARDRDEAGRPRQKRPRDELGRPLPYGETGVEPVPEEALPPDRTVEVARALVEEGRPFAAHEVLEARWKAGPEEERDLWQGLAQLCVGLTHAARGNAVGAARSGGPWRGAAGAVRGRRGSDLRCRPRGGGPVRARALDVRLTSGSVGPEAAATEEVAVRRAERRCGRT